MAKAQHHSGGEFWAIGSMLGYASANIFDRLAVTGGDPLVGPFLRGLPSLALGLVLMWSLFAQDYDAVEWCAIVMSGALAISSGLWWLSPRVGWYVGASGVLHSIMAAGAAKHLAERAWDRWILFGGLCVKLVWEQWGGHAAPLVVVDAHLYGAASGFAVGTLLSWRTAIIRLAWRPRSRA